MASYLNDHEEKQITQSEAPHITKPQVRGNEMGGEAQIRDVEIDKSDLKAGKGDIRETGTGMTPRPTIRNAGSVELGSRKA